MLERRYRHDSDDAGFFVPLTAAVALGTAALAAVCDLRTRRVPLWCSGLAVLAAFALNPWGLALGVLAALLIARTCGLRIGGADVAFSGAAGALAPTVILVAWIAILGLGLFHRCKPDFRFPAVPLFAIAGVIGTVW